MDCDATDVQDELVLEVCFIVYRPSSLDLAMQVTVDFITQFSR